MFFTEENHFKNEEYRQQVSLGQIRVRRYLETLNCQHDHRPPRTNPILLKVGRLTWNQTISYFLLERGVLLIQLKGLCG